MAPKDYLRAREDAQSSKDDESFCATIDGAPYFPNLVVGRQVQGSLLTQSSIEERDNSIKRVIEHLILQTTTTPKGGSLDSSSWKVAAVTGGNTNQLFCVSGIRCGANNGNGDGAGELTFKFPNDSLLVRLFGADGMIDRDAETSTYSSLADQQLALKYYGRFGNGRIEEMLINWTTLTEDDLMGRSSSSNHTTGSALLPPPNLNESIARELARLHATYELPSHLLMEGSSDSNSNSNNEAAAEDFSLPEPTLWTQLYPWLERSLEAEFFTDRDTQRANHELDPPLSSLKEEIDWLKSKVVVIGEKEESSSDSNNTASTGIGFCHNDLLASNIMMLTTSTTQAPSNSDDPRPSTNSTANNHLLLEGLRFIDFEYGGINYYAYDIANHFNEYAGGTAVEDNSTPDYDRCPNNEQRRAFLEAYADEYNNNNDKRRRSGGSSNDITAEELGARVDGFSLANHLVWGLWGVLQAATEGCEDGLDYLHYAKCRFDRYRHDKREKYGTSC